MVSTNANSVMDTRKTSWKRNVLLLKSKEYRFERDAFWRSDLAWTLGNRSVTYAYVNVPALVFVLYDHLSKLSDTCDVSDLKCKQKFFNSSVFGLSLFTTCDAKVTCELWTWVYYINCNAEYHRKTVSLDYFCVSK